MSNNQATLDNRAKAMIIRLPDEIRKKLDKLQFKSKKSFNKIIIEALITHLDREKI